MTTVSGWIDELDELDETEMESLQSEVDNWYNGNRSDVMATLEDLDPIDAAGLALAIFYRLGELGPGLAQDFARAVLKRGRDGSN